VQAPPLRRSRDTCEYLLYLIAFTFSKERTRDTAVGIATGYELHDRGVGVRVPVGSRIFSIPQRPDRFWGSPSLLSNGYRVQSGRGVKQTTHLQLVPRSRKHGSIHPLRHTPSWSNAELVKHRVKFTFLIKSTNYEGVHYRCLLPSRIVA
jgi:hypothetical protein